MKLLPETKKLGRRKVWQLALAWADAAADDQGLFPIDAPSWMEKEGLIDQRGKLTDLGNRIVNDLDAD